MNVRPRTLKLLAAATWFGGAGALLPKGLTTLRAAETIVPGTLWPWLAAGIGLVLGTIQAGWLLAPAGRKNLARIDGLTAPRPWSFFRPWFFLALAGMIAIGAIASRLAIGSFTGLCLVGAVDWTMGTGLLLSGSVFLRRSPH